MAKILYENDEQRRHVHTAWEKVEAIDETYWRCMDCRVTANEPVIKEASMKIIQIAVHGGADFTDIYGLGDDQKVYHWHNGEWVLNV